ncbi:MAG: tetratricopeptide repeat protein [Deltaproteobacteria bacterium]|nr:tetratricopeptide repeat protein [Deltaproteobacteria bacterium]
MSIDRDKVAKSALKFIQKGQFQKAIEEYRKVLSSDPRDIRTRLKLIDLYGRSGRKKEAIDECLQVAESYSDQGFYLKAIAVYKQALRIDPENPRLFSNMGELYVKQGLVGDALACFKKGVDCHRQRGQVGEAEELLTRMEVMAPENAAIKVHLAEMYLEDGRIDAFAGELDKIVLQLKGEGRARKLLQAVEGFYEKSHRHPVVLKRLAELYADLQEDEKALDVVRLGLASNPADRDLRLLALRAYLTLGNLSEARRMALGLYEEDPEDLFILEQLAAIAQARGDGAEETHAHKALAKVYARRGLPLKEEDHYRRVLELAPQDAEARLALGQVMGSEATEAESEVLELEGFWTEASPPAPPQESSDRVQEGLLEAELYLKYGLEEKAAEKLQELTSAAPDKIEIRQKLRDLCQRRGDRAGWVREQLHIAELHLRDRREGDALRAYQAILEVDPENPEARQAIQYLKPDVLGSKTAPLEIDVDGATVEFVEVGGEETVIHRRPAPAAGDEAQLRDAFAQADFYEAQGRTDEALGTLLRLRAQYPDSPHLLARLQRLGWQGEEEDGGGFLDLQSEVLDASSLTLANDFEGFQDFEVSELDDIVREFRSGIAEKLSDADYETHYNLGVAYKEMGLLDDALQEFQVAARSPEKAREAYTSISLVCRDLGRGAEATAALRVALAVPNNTAEDRLAILYELGVLAHESEDWEGALQAFQRAAAIDPTFRDLPRRLQLVTARRAG